MKRELVQTQVSNRHLGQQYCSSTKASRALGCPSAYMVPNCTSKSYPRNGVGCGSLVCLRKVFTATVVTGNILLEFFWMAFTILALQAGSLDTVEPIIQKHYSKSRIQRQAEHSMILTSVPWCREAHRAEKYEGYFDFQATQNLCTH